MFTIWLNQKKETSSTKITNLKFHQFLIFWTIVVFLTHKSFLLTQKTQKLELFTPNSAVISMSLRKKLLEAFPILSKDDFCYYTEIEGNNLSRDKVMAKLIIKYKNQKSKKGEKNGN